MERRLERRDFIKRAALGAAGASVATACDSAGSDAAVSTQNGNVVTGPEISWRLASSYPRSLDILNGSPEYVAERVAALTDGRFSIRVFPAGEIVPALQVMDAVQQGTVQAGFTADYYYVGKHPAFALSTGVPFGLDSRQHLAWHYEGGGLELVRSLFSDFGIIIFPCSLTGAQWGGWFRRPIESVSDMRGLRMRIPGIGGEIMLRLGVAVQVLAGGDIYPALERGVIDATEWVGPYDDEKLGFYSIAPNYYYPGWWEPGVTSSLQVSLSAWNELPEQYRQALASACREAALITLARYDIQNPKALNRLIHEHGVQLHRFSDEILEAAWRESNEYLEEQAAANADFRRVYESWKAYRDEVFPFFAGNELAYASFAFPKITG